MYTDIMHRKCENITKALANRLHVILLPGTRTTGHSQWVRRTNVNIIRRVLLHVCIRVLYNIYTTLFTVIIYL